MGPISCVNIGVDKHAKIFILVPLVGFIVLALTYVVKNQLVFAHDDAFITSAYAANFARGDGLVFNVGERVWGYTSPLHVLLQGLLTLSGIPTNAGAVWLSFVLLCPIAYLIYSMVNHALRQPLYALLVSYLAIVTIPFYLHLALETNLNLCLVLLNLHLVLGGRTRLAAFVGGLACLARPDSVLFGAPLLLACRSMRNWRCFLLFCLPGVVWLVFANAYYGVVLPQSFHSKQASTTFSHYVSKTAAGYFGTFPVVRPIVGDSLRVVEGTLKALLAVAGLGATRVRRSFPLLHALYIYPLLIFLAYALIGAPTGHVWQVAAGEILFSLTPFLGVFVIVRKLAALGDNRDETELSAHRQRWLLAVGVVMFFGVLSTNVQATHRYFWAQEDDYWRGRRHRTYVDIAESMNDNLPPQSSVLVFEPGTLRYFLRRRDIRVVDIQAITSRLPEIEPPQRSPCWLSPGLFALFSAVTETPRPHFFLAYEQSATPREVTECGELFFTPRRRFPNTAGYLGFYLLEITRLPPQSLE